MNRIRSIGWVAALMAIVISALLPVKVDADTSATQPATAPSIEATQAFDDLAKYYADASHPPDLNARLDALASPDANARASAGRYITALFAQTDADERNGRAQWKRLPYWGGGSESPARSFRQSAAKQFAEHATTDECIEPALWLIQQDRLADDQAQGLAALRKIQSPRMGQIFTRLLSPPSHSKAVLCGVIEEAGKRQMKELSPLIAPLATDYRTAVRQVALQQATALGFKPADYSPEHAFTPWLEGELTQVADMVMPAIPATAKWSRFKVTEHPAAGQTAKPQTREFSGWLLDQTPKTIHIVDLFGREISLAAADTVVSDRTLKTDADELLAVRNKKSDEPFGAQESLSERGGLTGQFEPRFVSVPEALLAAWALQRGDRATAAAVIFPRYDEADNEQWIKQAVGDILGWHYRDQMLRAFCYERDYPRTIRIAQHLQKPGFDQYSDQPRAKALADQLIARQGEDFKTLTLPTAAEWTELKKKLDRNDQTIYLAKRLRLLNCFQWGQPGGVDFDEDQFAGSRTSDGGMPGNAAATQPVKVINPFVELKKLDLSVKELKAILPYLADENFIPTYSYWRDFHPGRTMYHVNQFAASIVDHAAGRPMFDVGEYESADSAGRARMLTDLGSWVQVHASDSPEQILTDAANSATEFGYFQSAAMRLSKLNRAAALKILLTRMDHFNDNRADVVELLYWNFPDLVVDQAAKWTADADTGVSFWAALILMHNGEATRQAGLAALRPILFGDKAGEFYAQAMDELLAAKMDPAAMALAVGVIDKLGDRSGNLSYQRGAILKRLVLAGRSEALDYITRSLADTTPGGTSSGTRDGVEVSRQQVAGDSIAEDIMRWKDPDNGYDSLSPDDQRMKLRKELGQWVTDQFALIRSGKPSEIKADTRPLTPSRFQLDAP